MGCGDSKPGRRSTATASATKPISRCKDRRIRIKSVIDAREAFARAHVAYSHGLCKVGEAVHQFVLDDLSVASSSSSSRNSKPNSEKPKTGKKNTGTSYSPPLHSLGEEDDSTSHNTFEDSRSNFSFEGVGKLGQDKGLRQISDDYGKQYANRHGYDNYVDKGDFFSFFEDYSSDSIPKTSSPKHATPPPPTPPTPGEESAGWEFLNPFGTYDHAYSSRYKVGSVASSINSTEVREKEGIPELEIVPEDDEAMIHYPSKFSMKKSVTFEVESSLQTEESGPPSLQTALSMQGNRDVRKVAVEIKEHFTVASCSSGEMITALLRQLPLKGSKEEEGFIGGEPSTLDRLFAWEDKLFKEVKNVEKLRISYDKKFRKLNHLSKRGVEDAKIESTEASIHDLLIRIDISIRSINLISQKIHKLIEKDLQDHLVELFQGFKKMWNCLLECHQRQLLATVETKISNVTWKMATDAKATVQLKQEILNWSSRFSEWIKTQRGYIESIHGWVVFLLNEEPGKTAYGAFLLNEAPSIFVLCNDWLKLMEGVSEDAVTTAMHASARIVHDLCEAKNLENYPHRRRRKRRVKGWMCSVVFSTARRKDEEDSSKGSEMSEAKEKHGEIVRRFDEEASRTLRTSLIPVFDALGCFMLDASTSYEGHSSKWFGSSYTSTSFDVSTYQNSHNTPSTYGSV